MKKEHLIYLAVAIGLCRIFTAETMPETGVEEVSNSETGENFSESDSLTGSFAGEDNTGEDGNSRGEKTSKG